NAVQQHNNGGKTGEITSEESWESNFGNTGAAWRNGNHQHYFIHEIPGEKQQMVVEINIGEGGDETVDKVVAGGPDEGGGENGFHPIAVTVAFNFVRSPNQFVAVTERAGAPALQKSD